MRQWISDPENIGNALTKRNPSMYRSLNTICVVGQSGRSNSMYQHVLYRNSDWNSLIRVQIRNYSCKWAARITLVPYTRQMVVFVHRYTHYQGCALLQWNLKLITVCYINWPFSLTNGFVPYDDRCLIFYFEFILCSAKRGTVVISFCQQGCCQEVYIDIVSPFLHRGGMV